MCEIAKGQVLDDDARKLCKIINTKTNKEVAKELQGKFHFYSLSLRLHQNVMPERSPSPK